MQRSKISLFGPGPQRIRRHSALREESFYAISKAPIQIALRIFAISEFGRNRNDALVLVISQCYEHMDSSDRGDLRLAAAHNNAEDTYTNRSAYPFE